MFEVIHKQAVSNLENYQNPYYTVFFFLKTVENLYAVREAEK